MRTGSFSLKSALSEVRSLGTESISPLTTDGIEVSRFGNTIVLRGRSKSKILADGKVTNREGYDETEIYFYLLIGSRFGRFC